ncbi:DnaB-like helicase C-terminal domain-containing protein [Azospirillum sp. Sh1]|uniref:DnaB-like helicase C-terminal domain-containing protein n=1 Tax=Azospirillum sp. Sh1 TaxID=2607285 RepID=UPI0011EF5708|nr:DnaB-like helicase C-terminal domain-containing protein [Azospirillum sp. Sh1]KAA0576699.1 hypothetical protein FZ029_12595 [Azospirillum sp. Sh1]
MTTDERDYATPDAATPARTESVPADLFAKLSNEPVEQAFLGAVLTSAKALDRCIPLVQPEDFYDPVHGAIWTAAVKRRESGAQVNAALLADVGDRLEAEFPELKQHGGGRAYLIDLQCGMITTINARDYAATIRGLAKRRRLAEAALATANACLDFDRPMDDLLGQIVGEAERLVETGRSRTRGAVLEDMLETFRHPPVVYSTGMPSLDAAMVGGLWPGRVYGIAAHDKAGKTGLAGTISFNLNEAGVKHGYFALEMGADQIEIRQISRALRVGTTKVMERDRGVMEALAQYRLNAADNIVYVDLPGGTVDELRSEILAARSQHRITGFILDYWQLVEGKTRQQSDEEHLRRVAQWLANVAKRLNIWIVVLAQLADDGEATALSRRGLNRAVDQLYFLHRPQGEEFAWLQMKVSRYTPQGDIGTKDEPSLRLSYPGPYFEDWAARGMDPAAVQARYEMADG